MPQLLALAPLLAGIGGLASAGVGIGEAVSNSGSPAPTTPTAPAPTPPNAQALAQQKALVAGQVPNVDSAVSGLASPGYLSDIAQTTAGTIGTAGSTAAGAQATGQQFTPANSQPTNAAVNGQSVNLSDFINQFSQ